MAGQMDDHIGPQPPVLRVDVLLLDEIAVFQHAGHLDDAAELDFAPAAADLRAAERLDEVRRLAAEFFLRLPQRFDLLGQSAVGLDAGLFDLDAAWRPPCRAIP